MKKKGIVLLALLTYFLLISSLCVSEELKDEYDNLCPIRLDSMTRNGIDFLSDKQGNYYVDGISEESINYNIFHSKTELPEKIEAGKFYHLEYEDTSGTDCLRFCIYYYDETGKEEYELINTSHSIYFVIPADARGLLVRIRVTKARVQIDKAIIHPIITEVKSVIESDKETTNTIIDNICPIRTTIMTTNGVDFVPDGKGRYFINGISEKGANYNLYYNKTELPEGITAGELYHLEYEDTSGTNNLRICMYYYDKDGNEEYEFLNASHSIDFVIPEQAKGMLIRIRVVMANVSIDKAIVYPVITKTEGIFEQHVKTSDDIENICPIRAGTMTTNGIDFVSDGKGQYMVNGISEKGANYNLYYNKTELPEGITAGELYHLEYEDTSGTNNLRICMYYYDKDGNEEYEFLNANHSIDFVVPEQAKGMLIRIRVVMANVSIDKAIVYPVITKTEGIFEQHVKTSDDNENLCPVRTSTMTTNGIDFVSDGKGQYMVNGISEKGANYNLFYNKTELPEGITAGELYHLEYEDTSGTNNLRICMYYYDKDGNEEYEFLNASHSIDFVVPEQAKGMLIRIRVVTSNVRIQKAVVCPIIKYEDKILMAQDTVIDDVGNVCPIRASTMTTNGIDFIADGKGRYIVNGRSEKGANYNLYYSKTELPEGIEPGKTYRLEYEDTSLTNYLRVYVYWFDESGGVENELFNSYYSTNFTVPSDAYGLLIRLRVAAADVTISNAVVRPIIREVGEINEPQPMITIIDDDGCARYYSDLLPLCMEKGVSISAAVVPTQIEERESGDTRYWMSWNEIEECYAKGIEILSHTYDHADNPIYEARSIDEIRDTYKLAKEILYDHGIDTNILVYCRNSGSLPKCQWAAKDVYDYAIRAGGNVNNEYGNMDSYNIMRYKIQYNYDFDPEKMKELIYQLSENGTGWMVWMIHTSDSQWCEEFVDAISQSIDYAKELGIPIVTAEEGASQYAWK